MKDIGTWWFLLGDTRVVCECDLNSLGVGAEKVGKYAKWHSDKTAKTGFVGFGIIYLGGYREFLGGIFLCIAGVVGFIEGPFFHRSALIAAMVCKGGAMPSITLAWVLGWWLVLIAYRLALM